MRLRIQIYALIACMTPAVAQALAQARPDDERPVLLETDAERYDLTQQGAVTVKATNISGAPIYYNGCMIKRLIAQSNRESTGLPVCRAFRINALPPGGVKTFEIPIGRLRELHENGHLSNGVYRMQLLSFWWHMPHSRDTAIDPALLLSNPFELVDAKR